MGVVLRQLISGMASGHGERDRKTSPRNVTPQRHPATSPRNVTPQRHPATSPRNVTPQRHPATSPRNVTPQRHPATSPCNVTLQRHPATSPSLVVALLRTREEVSSTCSLFVSESGRPCEDATISDVRALMIYRRPSPSSAAPSRTCTPSRTRLRAAPLSASHPSTTLNTIAWASLAGAAALRRSLACGRSVARWQSSWRSFTC